MSEIVPEPTVPDIDQQQPPLTKLQWSKNYEIILADWSDKAMSFRYLHSKCNRYYNNLNNSITIPVIVLTTLTGVANFAQSRVPPDYVPYYTIAVGSLNIISGLITTISHFLKIAELNESHRVAAISWGKFCRNIKIELAKHPEEREALETYLKRTKDQYDLLSETSPDIRHKVILAFNKKFANKNFFKPEICDSLESVTTTIYQEQDKPKDDVTRTVQNINEKKNNLAKTMQIEDFIRLYKLANNRDPTTEEIYDNLENNVGKKYLDIFISKNKQQVKPQVKQPAEIHTEIS